MRNESEEVFFGHSWPKRGEPFDPFAPSVLGEAVLEWFEEDDAVPFTMQQFQSVKMSASDIRRHTRGCRLQKVSRRINRRYYQLIESFGVPMHGTQYLFQRLPRLTELVVTPPLLNPA